MSSSPEREERGGIGKQPDGLQLQQRPAEHQRGQRLQRQGEDDEREAGVTPRGRRAPVVAQAVEERGADEQRRPAAPNAIAK